MPPYHKDISLYFSPAPPPNPSQQAMQGLYQTFMYQVNSIPAGPEKSVAMRKLLESYDAAMRALST